MSLAGQAIVASFNDITPEGRTNMYEWHNREHMVERLAIPGFLRGRRFIGRRASPEFMFLYEARDMSVLAGPDYFARLDNPTPWTSLSTKEFRNSFRSVFDVIFSKGVGMGGAILAMRVQAAQPKRLDDFLAATTLLEIEAMVGVTGAHLAVADRGISSRDTAEKRGRGAQFRLMDRLVMVEATGEDVLADIRARQLSDVALSAAGAAEGIEGGIYLLEMCRLPSD